MVSMRLKTQLGAGFFLGIVAGIVAAWLSIRFPKEDGGRVMADAMHSHYHVHAPDIDHGHVHSDFVTGGHTHEHSGH